MSSKYSTNVEFGLSLAGVITHILLSLIGLLAFYVFNQFNSTLIFGHIHKSISHNFSMNYVGTFFFVTIILMILINVVGWFIVFGVKKANKGWAIVGIIWGGVMIITGGFLHGALVLAAGIVSLYKNNHYASISNN